MENERVRHNGTRHAERESHSEMRDFAAANAIIISQEAKGGARSVLERCMRGMIIMLNALHVCQIDMPDGRLTLHVQTSALLMRLKII